MLDVHASGTLRQENLERLIQKLAPSVAEHAFRGDVDERDSSAGVDLEDALRGGFEKRLRRGLERGDALAERASGNSPISYGWPGDVRELQNVVERACALADGNRITRLDLPEYLPQGTGMRGSTTCATGGPALPDSGNMPLKDAKEKLDAGTRGFIPARSSERHAGNVSAAAKAAGIDRKTFHCLINKYQIRG
jgi:transcriptional regulator of acetoin/glycerol metabolism